MPDGRTKLKGVFTKGGTTKGKKEVRKYVDWEFVGDQAVFTLKHTKRVLNVNVLELAHDPAWKSDSPGMMSIQFHDKDGKKNNRSIINYHKEEFAAFNKAFLYAREEAGVYDRELMKIINERYKITEVREDGGELETETRH